MATLNYAFVSVCEGGGHAALDISLNGGNTRRVVYTVDELREPLGSLTIEERENLALLILKVHFAGKTRQEMRDELIRPGGVLVVV